MSQLNRRGFLKRSLAAGLAGGAALIGAPATLAAAAASGQVGTLIDLTLCDGCPNEETPICTAACRQKNAARFPRPVSPIPGNWPNGKPEDWSDKQNVTDRLTPYNWTYVQRVVVEWQGQKQELSVPRRCMHCDNPACVAICPYSAQSKKPEGPVLIDEKLCLGGAKCRDVCPWGIPARQAGVGLYLNMAPYAGGGVMYKCDLCYDRIQAGGVPACIAACPRKALAIGEKGSVLAEAQRRARSLGGEVYGARENGGTSTYYVSAVPFTVIHKALLQQSVDGKPGRSGLPVAVGNYMDQVNGMATGLLAAPVAGLLAAGLVAYRTMRGEE
ncbi:MAG: 4Fe-4S dicluster domain-containing protein [Chloroflexota bacterium]